MKKTTLYVYPASIRIFIVFFVYTPIILVLSLFKSDLYAPDTEMTFEFGVLIPALNTGSLTVDVDHRS